MLGVAFKELNLKCKQNLVMGMSDRNYETYPNGKVVTEKGPDWQNVKQQVGSHNLEVFGSSDITGNTGLPMLNSSHAFEGALRNSEVVIYVDHGNGSTTDDQGNPISEFIPTHGISIGDTLYGPSGRLALEPTGTTGGQPETNAAVIVNFSCNSARNTELFNLTGPGTQYVIGIDSGRRGGTTGIGTMEKAAAAFAKAYGTTKGPIAARVQAGVQAAQAVLSASKIPDDRGDKVVVVKVKD
jgi:hypothetical protein